MNCDSLVSQSEQDTLWVTKDVLGAECSNCIGRLDLPVLELAHERESV